MKIKVLPKIQFDKSFSDFKKGGNKKFSDYTSTAFISILDPDNEEELYPSSSNFLQVRMWDIEKTLVLDEKNYLTVTSDNVLIKIIAFCQDHKDKDFIIHCSAGISRSGAIARFIHEKNNSDDFYNENPYIQPNLYVLNRLKELDNILQS